MRMIELANMLVADAKLYRSGAMESVARNGHMNDATGTAIDQRDVDALLTDFINFIAGRRGVDLALYASDLAK